ncbi:MAG: hypothetical protein LC136_04720 [Burkholderiales bacterium]|nr:hypothetical protein [Burkholderiales bacterium]
MPDKKTLAETIAEGRRQARNFRTVILDRDDALRLLDVAEAAAADQEEMAALGNGVDPALSVALSAFARLDKE